jgi:predicted tellurium resistance membrane protein TerC
VLELFSNPDIWVALLTLTALEIVLGIDNIVFISILSSKLPAAQQQKARMVGLGAAMIMRILLLFAISWVIGLTATWFDLLGQEISGRDLILISGGLFLIGKATFEIHERLEGAEHGTKPRFAPTFVAVIVQIMILDMVFSIDSVITAVGMADDIEVMVAAVMIAVGVMMISAGRISAFVDRHPTVKMLALSFLILIGTSLVAEGFEQHIPKGYIYFAMAFSVMVEALNLRAGRKRAPEPRPLKNPYTRAADVLEQRVDG